VASSGEILTDSEVLQLMQEADENGDGKVNYKGVFILCGIYLDKLSCYKTESG